MNILYIANITLSVHDLKWMSWFDAQANIDVYAVDGSGHDFSHDSTLEGEYRKTNIRILPPLPLFSPFAFLKNRNSVSRLNSYIKENKIDLVHILFATPSALWGLHVDVPYMITTRGSDILAQVHDMYHSPAMHLKKKFQLYLYRKAFRKAAIISSTSHAQARAVHSITKRASHVVRTGVDVEKISGLSGDDGLPVELKGEAFVFSPRWVRPVYDTRLQIEAIRQLPEKIIEQYIFVFLKYKKLGEEYLAGIEHDLQSIPGLHYIIYDHLYQDEMMQCYKHASLAIMTPVRDGSPNSALEAMAARCPLIMRKLDYDQDLYGNACLLLEQADAGKLSLLMEKALSAYPSELLEQAFLQVSKHGNREVEMGKILQLYKEALS